VEYHLYMPSILISSTMNDEQISSYDIPSEIYAKVRKSRLIILIDNCAQACVRVRFAEKWQRHTCGASREPDAVFIEYPDPWYQRSVTEHKNGRRLLGAWREQRKSDVHPDGSGRILLTLLLGGP